MEYSVYSLTSRDILKYGGFGLLLSAVIAAAFYKSVTAFLILAPFGAAGLPLLKRPALKRQRLDILAQEFKEAVSFLSGFLFAGVSPENAFELTQKEIRSLYGTKSMMAKELETIVQGLKLNRPAEQLLMEFAARSTLQDVRNFAEVFAIAKRSGGDLREISERTAEVIREKAAVAEEIKTITAARRYEQQVMNLLPIGLIFYINAASEEFLEVMYTTAAGRMVMTICLLLFGLSWYLSKRILEIEI